MIQPLKTTQRKLPVLVNNCYEKKTLHSDRFLRIGIRKVDYHMNDSYNIEYIQTFSIDQLSKPIQFRQSIQSDKEVKMVHSGFSAGKLENQNGFTNIVHNTSILSTNRGVTL